MSIIQDMDLKYPYKQYIYIIYEQFRSKAIASQWLHRSRSFCVKNETAQVRILPCFFFLFFISSVYVWKCDEGFVHFLHIVAKSPSAFP